jgi:CRP-like cAMP-binding protein
MEHNFEANFFTLLELLDRGSRLEIDGVCTKISFPPNQVIYQQGDESEAIYIVASGVVEAMTHSPDGRQTRSLGFMSRGDFFGDLGVLTNHPRLATIHSCEPTQVLQIEKTAFLQLLEKIPKMGAYFSRNLARRLHKTSTEAHLNIYSLDLSGNLQHFDLLTIFQAITSMNHSGELHLNNSSHDLIGGFFFREGRVEHARFLHLEGVEAVWQGFVESATEGGFTFRVMAEPKSPFSKDHLIRIESTDLLMQGVGRRDTYQAIPEELRRMEGRLSRKAEELQWNDPETAPLAERIWELIARRPQPMISLWRRLNYSALTFLETVNGLVQTEQAELLLDTPVEASPESPAEAPPEP